MTTQNEWLEADGLGGFASGPVAGPRTRRYHALLLTSEHGPAGRRVLVNGFDAFVETSHGVYPLTAQCYQPGVTAPNGAEHVQSFTADPWPRWVFALPDGTLLAQEIFVPKGLRACVVTWRLLTAKPGVTLRARAFLSGRDYHATHRENAAFRFDAEQNGARVTWSPYAGVPAIHAIANGAYAHEPHWYRNFLYAEERARGLDDTEDLATPGVFTWDLSRQEAVWIFADASALPALTSEPALVAGTAATLAQAEQRRRAAFPTPLHRAADAYFVQRGADLTLAAGYPWFTDWGRDTFIALRGLCLSTRRLADARGILLSWAGAISEGMVPNRFPDHGEQPEFNSVDASLWFVVAAHEFLAVAERVAFRVTVEERDFLRRAIESILVGFSQGTRHRIKCDDDGLLAAGERGVQLTWMDAKVGDWVVTPRIGKPVEVQALWLNALWIGAQFAPQRWQPLLDRGLAAFQTCFRNERLGCLYDVIDVDHERGRVDATIRPNQIFAVGGLPFTLLRGEQAQRVLATVEEHLLTPLGLRSLSPRDPAYRGRYEGGVHERDGGYHQGPVWPWLIGAFVEAWLNVHGSTRNTRATARERFVKPLFAICPSRAWDTFPRSPTATPRTCRAAARGRRGPSANCSASRATCLSNRRHSRRHLLPPSSRAANASSSPRERPHPPTEGRKLMNTTTPESLRLAAANAGREAWRRWGPYLSERQWGTVREDYSAHGTAWDYFPHDHARSRAYRWGEDGIAGISDDQQRLCLAVALWNGRDPILKERLFGLTNGEGNHGEDVKELYYYLDATPTHSYLKMLYKYPQRAFPYAELVEENRRRGKDQPEFELLDTGVFDDDRYFDVTIEYAKAAPDDLLLRITVHNRGRDAAALRVVPQLWFRNTWSWQRDAARPTLAPIDSHGVLASHPELGDFRLSCDGDPELLFCENDTNLRRLYGRADASGYFKDGINDYIVHGQTDAVNPARSGTKAAAHYTLNIAPQRSTTLRLRLRKQHANSAGTAAFSDFDAIFAARITEADAFYAELQRDIPDADARLVQRQAFAGMIWSKQFFSYDVPEWLRGDPAQPPPPDSRKHGRNREWLHLNNADVISMPDKWEYPWYAAWDLAFHCIPLAMVDAEFAKGQLVLLTREWYMHPNGQLPAYEWAFGDVNPPVHAWATWRVFQIDRKQRGDQGDLAFLERVFHKLLLNFTWWVNRKDAQGRNIFQGGFLGLDNIGVFDRSAPLPTGGHINQADGTSWMAMYSLNLMRIALELARHNHVYEDIATKFFEHFLHIAEAMNNIGDEGIGLWCEDDEFYYDVLNLPNGDSRALRIRSMVGLIPLYAVEVLSPELLDEVPEFARRLKWFLNYRPDLAKLVSRWEEPGMKQRHLLSLLRGHRMKCLLRRMLDETEFLSDYGVRAISRHHLEHPYEFHSGDVHMGVRYEPAESSSGLFGGNSNWRGPIWMPVNYLLIESLQKFHHYYGDDFKVECPTGSGKFLTLAETAAELSRRLTRIFLVDENGERPVLKYHPMLARDPHFKDLVLFHEYFHGDSGRGVGASHQTGWTGLVAKLIQPRDDGSSATGAPSEQRRNKKLAAAGK